MTRPAVLVKAQVEKEGRFLLLEVTGPDPKVDRCIEDALATVTGTSSCQVQYRRRCVRRARAATDEGAVLRGPPGRVVRMYNPSPSRHL